jgi:hypothetical protein
LVVISVTKIRLKRNSLDIEQIAQNVSGKAREKVGLIEKLEESRAVSFGVREKG